MKKIDFEDAFAEFLLGLAIYSYPWMAYLFLGNNKNLTPEELVTSGISISIPFLFVRLLIPLHDLKYKILWTIIIILSLGMAIFRESIFNFLLAYHRSRGFWVMPVYGSLVFTVVYWFRAALIGKKRKNYLLERKRELEELRSAGS